MRLMTWCVTETHHLSVIQVFELQGYNVARLVCKDLSQIAGAEGSLDLYVGGLPVKKNLHCGCKETTEKDSSNHLHTCVKHFNASLTKRKAVSPDRQREFRIGFHVDAQMLDAT